MNILLTAPQPFYQERGTPIAVRLMAETLCGAGHTVDLLAYHEGEDIDVPGLTIHRIAPPPLVRGVPIGFSWKKLVCDVSLFFRTAGLLRRNSYDVIHAVEESVFTSLAARAFSREKLVYDMDSLMADQLVEKWAVRKHVKRLLNRFEGFAVRRSDMVLPVCQALADKVDKVL